MYVERGAPESTCGSASLVVPGSYPTAVLPLARGGDGEGRGFRRRLVVEQAQAPARRCRQVAPGVERQDQAAARVAGKVGSHLGRGGERQHGPVEVEVDDAGGRLAGAIGGHRAGAGIETDDGGGEAVEILERVDRGLDGGLVDEGKRQEGDHQPWSGRDRARA